LRKDVKREIIDSVSTLRNIFVNLKNSAEEHMGKITLFESQVKKVKAELRESRASNLSVHKPPCMDGIGNTPATSARQVQPSSGGARKLYSDVMRATNEKRHRLMVKSKSSQPP
jgi:hypothetical protein